ncbi:MULTISPECIES: helix-turn-helix transcriptional regulator [Paenibacillus]|uniref:helix-turn-helix transcriptional regulator n=1 Tax=Paenibacillus TaxID=44249 RepID=UPI0022B8C54B|nr:AraC family transcriptional regulator [Paenibacillus caseinilyticus]MCZ8518545.1 AraC family transcriptional regulator [Paenibacillus caseinilyticus]
MTERSGIKYTIGHTAFAIQQLQRTGETSMPRPHSHEFYELYYLFHGERVYFINGKVYTARKGDLVVVVPNDLHSTASSAVAEFERMLVHYSPGFLGEEGPKLMELPPFRTSTLLSIPMKEQPEVEHLLLQLHAECRDQPPLYETCVRHLLGELLVRLHRRGTLELEQEPAASMHPMHQKVTEIASYIHEHYRDELTLGGVAKQFFISPAYLSRVFLKLTGFHFSEYIRVVRIREAQKLLRSTRDKVQWISEQVGFEHISHFNKTFKRISGLSPLQYRDQHR